MVLRGTQVLTDRGDLHPNGGQVGQGLFNFVTRFAQAHHHAGLGHETSLGTTGENGEATQVTGRGTNGALESGHGFDVVIHYVGLGVENQLQRGHVTLHVTDQHLDLGLGATGANRANGVGNGTGTTVGQIVAGDARNDSVGEVQPNDGLGDALGLRGVQGQGLARIDQTETAGPRAPFTVDHEGRGAVGPALKDVGAAGLFTDRHQSEVFGQFAQRVELVTHMSRDAKPLGLTRGDVECHVGVDSGLAKTANKRTFAGE